MGGGVFSILKTPCSVSLDLHSICTITGFVRVMENLGSRGISYFFQALKVMEFRVIEEKSWNCIYLCL